MSLYIYSEHFIISCWLVTTVDDAGGWMLIRFLKKGRHRNARRQVYVVYSSAGREGSVTSPLTSDDDKDPAT